MRDHFTGADLPARDWLRANLIEILFVLWAIAIVGLYVTTGLYWQAALIAALSAATIAAGIAYRRRARRDLADRYAPFFDAHDDEDAQPWPTLEDEFGPFPTRDDEDDEPGSTFTPYPPR